ncbi:hypothetical protein AVEN_59962-1 [Araneus ventricosus]|uniref:Uncharacterized protein n=1 Tax=Araneus ventricosus TaxID=182803 RepID=A0A4Y2RTY4_ARAVE|nr:hypothetical protein AVEN_59962-1 [Araneus ventricosus]
MFLIIKQGLDSLMVRSRIWGWRAPGSKPDYTNSRAAGHWASHTPHHRQRPNAPPGAAQRGGANSGAIIYLSEAKSRLPGERQDAQGHRMAPN